MINHRNTSLRLTVIALAVVGPVNLARAQAGKPATPAPAPAPAPPTATPAAPGPDTTAPEPEPSTDVLPDVPPGEGGGTTGAGAESNLGGPTRAPSAGAAPPPLVFPTAAASTVRRRRVKPLQLTIGLDPTAPDFGGEADLISTINEGSPNVKPRRWLFALHGSLRAPFRLGIGPSSAPPMPGVMQPQNELHSPAHVIGALSNDWNSVGLFPSPLGSLYLTAGNAVVAGTMIISTGTFTDAGYKQLNEMAGISQAYVTMRFNEAFGSHGGVALNAGAFSNRYGLAGPRQQSSGYYQTQLFGRTRVAGADLVLDIDLTEHLELVIEEGFGSKIEVIPWLTTSLSGAPYLPDQGPSPQGSNFVQQAHAALLVDDWLSVAGHSMISWSPNDLSASTGALSGNVPTSRLNITGGEVHVDSTRFGSGYVGYSHLSAENVLSLADGIGVLHSNNGFDLTKYYFNPAYMYKPGGMQNAVLPGSVGDSGKIDTVLFQYVARLVPLLDLPVTGRDLSVALYGMFNHVTADMLAGGKQDKFKFGAEAEASLFRFMALGVRFDRVMPNGGNADVAYSALSPRLIIHSTWMSREYLLLSYTRYFLGSALTQTPMAPYEPFAYTPDKNLIVLSAVISF